MGVRGGWRWTGLAVCLGLGLGLHAKSGSKSAGESGPNAPVLRFEQREHVCACFAPGTSEDVVSAFHAALHSTAPNAYQIFARWSSTATDGPTGANGLPVTLTYSFVADYSTGNPATSNTLHATLDAKFGATATWKNLFRQIFDEWSARTGLTFVEVSDDGAPWPDSPGVLGTRGDLRIVALAIDGLNNVLAYNYFPNNGDMALDSAENWANPANSYRFMRNIILHELGHGIGLEHVNPRDGTKLMEAFLNTGFLGPQDDDIRGANSYYGDALEPNNGFADAVSVGTFAAGSSASTASLHAHTDVDWYRVSATAGQSVAFETAPLGSAYSVGPDPGSPVAIDTRALNPLRLDVYDQSGSSLLGAASAGAGATAASGPLTVPAGQSSVTVRVSTTGSTSAVQRYQLRMVTPDPTVRTLTLVAENPTSVIFTVSPADTQDVGSAATPASLTYLVGQAVTITAPAAGGPGSGFSHWIIDGVNQTAGATSVSVSMSANHVASAVYAAALTVNAGADATAVLGETVPLGAQAAGGRAPYTYSWAPAATLSAANISNPLATPVENTTYVVTVTDADSDTAADSVVVQLVPPLVADAGPDQSALAGTVFVLSGSASGGAGPYSYVWSPNNLLTGLQGPTTTAACQSTTTFTLTATDSAGRVATDALSVTVPTTLAVSAGADQTISAGSAVTLTATATGGVAPYRFTWTPGGVAAEANGSSLRVEPTQTTEYTVVVVDNFGQQALDRVRVVIPTPLSVTATATRTLVGPGESTVLSAAVLGGFAPFEFEWQPAEGLAEPRASTTNAEVLEATRYTVRVRDGQGSSAEASVEVRIDDPVSSVAPAGGCGFGATALLLPLLLTAPRRRR